MKTIFALMISLITTASYAGDNGSYITCLSASGRTSLVYGEVGTYENGTTLMFSIDGQSIGKLEVDNSVFRNFIDEVTTQFIEADSEKTEILTIQKKSETRYDVLSGLDPRSNKPLTHTIQLKCKTTYNPI